MIVATSRPVHTSLLHTARDDQDTLISGTGLPLQPSFVTLATNKTSSVMTIESSVASRTDSKRAMTTALTGRKRRATSPAHLNRAAAMEHLTIHRQFPITTRAGAFSLHPSNDSPIDRLSLRPVLTTQDEPLGEHIVRLSSIEQVMPRAYIRVCLAYRVPSSGTEAALSRLSNFVKKTVEAKPYLAGYVIPIDGSTRTGPVEIRFRNEDYLNYPAVVVRELLDDSGSMMDYDELDAAGFPPSSLRPEKVSDLPATIADERRAPVFRTQANLVKGGIIVSLYLHHCITDGTGLGLLATGSVLDTNFAFKRNVDGQKEDIRSLGKRLAAFARHESDKATNLSYCSPDQTFNRKVLYKHLNCQTASNAPGRGCIISFPDAAVEELRSDLESHTSGTKLTKHDTLQAMIWCHMVRARLPAISSQTQTSKLLIPVNIRKKLRPQLPDSYFGAAVDFASAEVDIAVLASGTVDALVQAAKAINSAVTAVDDDYIRAVIKLAKTEDPTIDVRDLLASNINRVTGADMYITSWDRLKLYEATLDMGFGRPDWIRKPWSRDPGSCIILPRNEDKAQFEVVIQMTCADMEVLLNDRDFMKFVDRVID